MTLVWILFVVASVLLMKIEFYDNSPEGLEKHIYRKDSLTLQYVAMVSFSLLFRALIPMQFYLSQLEEHENCFYFFTDFLPTIFMTIGLSCVAGKLIVLREMLKLNIRDDVKGYRQQKAKQF
jgi:hypothetical protein